MIPKKGDKVKLISSPSDNQDRWGGNSSHWLLKPNIEYTVKNVDVRSWHTKVYLEETEGIFNSVIFDIV